MNAVLTEFNPPADIEFNDFLREVSIRALSDFIRVLVEGTLVRFIAQMNEQGLDKDLSVDFSKDIFNKDGINHPALVMSLKAGGEQKDSLILVLTEDRKRIRNVFQNQH